jgi:hypothetical protein
MARRTSEPQYRKANEGVVVGLLCGIAGARRVASLSEARDMLDEMQVPPALSLADEVFPWEVPVPWSIMDPGQTLLKDELCGAPGRVWLVKDSEISGREGLWFCSCDARRFLDDAEMSVACRMLVHNQDYHGGRFQFVAVQVPGYYDTESDG